MTGLFSVYKRELLSLWVTPLAWVLLVVFLILQGGIFYSIVLHFASQPEVSVDYGPLQAYYGQSIFLVLTLLLLCPALTMRTFAEERRTGTIEALLTAPVEPAGVVLGKYLAVLTTYVVMWTPTLLYVVILRDTGAVDWGSIASSYLGIAGIGCMYLGVGILASALTRSQLVALLLTLLVLFGLFVLGLGHLLYDEGPLLAISEHVSMQAQLDELSRGVVETRRLVFNIGVAALALFLAIRVVGSWRWQP